MKRSCLKTIYVLVTYIVCSCGIAGQAHGKDVLDIPLGVETPGDLRIVYVMPPEGSSDQVQFGTDGILISQKLTRPDEKTGVTGIKVLSSVHGDFTFEIDFECRQLNRPPAGWGHGLITRFLFDDEEQPVISVGIAAVGKYEKAYFLGLGNNKFVTIQSNFTKGVWQVSRVGSELILNVTLDGNPPEEIVRVPCSSADVKQVHLWATRLPKENAPCEYLLKHISLRADQLNQNEELTPDKEEEESSGYSTGTVIILFLVINLLIYGIYVIATRKRSTSINEHS